VFEIIAKTLHDKGFPSKCCLPILLELIWYGGSDPKMAGAAKAARKKR
jgi:hypothetical protein